MNFTSFKALLFIAVMTVSLILAITADDLIKGKFFAALGIIAGALASHSSVDKSKTPQRN